MAALAKPSTRGLAASLAPSAGPLPACSAALAASAAEPIWAGAQGLTDFHKMPAKETGSLCAGSSEGEGEGSPLASGFGPEGVEVTPEH